MIIELPDGRWMVTHPSEGLINYRETKEECEALTKFWNYEAEVMEKFWSNFDD